MCSDYQRWRSRRFFPPGAGRALALRAPGPQAADRHAHAAVLEPLDEGRSRAEGSTHLIWQQVQKRCKCLRHKHYSSSMPQPGSIRELGDVISGSTTGSTSIHRQWYS
jgi:hypothetical protein